MKILDSTFLIDIIRKKRESAEKSAEFAHEKLYTTRINVFEIQVGAFSIKPEKDREIRLSEISVIAENLSVLELDKKAATLAAEIAGKLNREGLTIDTNDCLIAGIALSNGINSIVTRNAKDFEKIEGIRVETY